jgi:hypothetical protein
MAHYHSFLTVSVAYLASKANSDTEPIKVNHMDSQEKSIKAAQEIVDVVRRACPESGGTALTIAKALWDLEVAKSALTSADLSPA